MISTENLPLNNESSDADFTEENYRKLLILAKQNYTFASYGDIPWGTGFVLWRHDCDYSLNRSHALAKLEAAEGVSTTYFLNPHCEYYNLFEKSQYQHVREIIEMGHDIGLHFDSAFYGSVGEQQLSELVSYEADILERLLGVRPAAFSFHNPVDSDLACEANEYAGMMNCYSRRFKNELPYCSDSNGYWRFRRLQDVLSSATDTCLQVLTHPGWWQNDVMPPRSRIFRSVHGRALATMKSYDDHLASQGRINILGPATAISFLRSIDAQKYELYDILWNNGNLSTLYGELWRLHQLQLGNLCLALLEGHFMFSGDEASTFVKKWSSLSVQKRFEWLSGCSVAGIGGVREDAYRKWGSVYRQSLKGDHEHSRDTFEAGCVFICGVVEALIEWGMRQSFRFGGIGISSTQSLRGNGQDKQAASISATNAHLIAPKRAAETWGRFVGEILEIRSSRLGVHGRD